jgi:hypothetical protein
MIGFSALLMFAPTTIASVASAPIRPEARE